jgi:hypothetical protein
MHLPQDDHAVHISGGLELRKEKIMHSHGMSSPRSKRVPADASAAAQEGNLKANEVRILVPRNRARDEVQNTVLTAWTILIQRYQRDAFHHLTWGPKDAPEDGIQCIAAVELDLSGQCTVSSLSQKLVSIRSTSIRMESAPAIFLNDGTKNEVWTFLRDIESILTIDSGLSGSHSALKRNRCAQPRNGFRQPCHGTKAFLSSIFSPLFLIPFSVTLIMSFQSFCP